MAVSPRRRQQLHHLAGFLVAGGSAFLVDAGILMLLVHFGANPFAARPFAIACAMVVGWLINRTWTFPMPGPPRLGEFLRYAAVAWLSVSINYAIYAGLLIVWPTMPLIEALVIATAIAMFFSYFGYRLIAFRKPRSAVSASGPKS
ncbi:GtrA family protein [Kaistia dalseonensis]|uniref:Flippase GtrA n=1 Tax=Kaistia dalseonensis TaxID=410840 RepID=A0ABU0HDT6_9HYPH|nr:GtrA family protein [Kaistia dalseonensis]MCX5497023.1 GtrA family protein [Kaistia dalseonensis]MDQ0439649.1 putative flippase GtrA [Kaistia dalseonensis]